LRGVDERGVIVFGCLARACHRWKVCFGIGDFRFPLFKMVIEETVGRTCCCLLTLKSFLSWLLLAGYCLELSDIQCEPAHVSPTSLSRCRMPHQTTNALAITNPTPRAFAPAAQTSSCHFLPLTPANVSRQEQAAAAMGNNLKWAPHRETCRRLWEEGKSVTEVAEYMKEHHNFTPRCV